MAAEPCLWRWQLESLSTQVRPDSSCQPPGEENGGRQRVICVPLWFCFTSWSLHWPPRGGEDAEAGGEQRHTHLSSYSRSISSFKKVMSCQWVILIFFSYHVLISAFMDPQCPPTNKSAKGIISEIVREHNIWYNRKWSGSVCVWDALSTQWCTLCKLNIQWVERAFSVVYCQTVQPSNHYSWCARDIAMISDQRLNLTHTQPQCLLNKSKVEQPVKRFGTAVQLSGWSV